MGVELEEKIKQVAFILDHVQNKTFRMNQIKKRGFSKSKRVRNHRLKRFMQLSMEISAAYNQAMLVQSQPTR